MDVFGAQADSQDHFPATSLQPESENIVPVPMYESNGDQVDSQGHFPATSLQPESKTAVPVPTYQSDLLYNTNHKRRGFAVIFNQEIFEKSLNLKVRTGTKEDCKSLEVILQTLGFEIQRHDDLDVRNVLSEIDKLGAKDFSDCDCLLVIVLSHGIEKGIYARDSLYSQNQLFDPFTPDKCPSLAGKPKLFVIQACRGEAFDDGIDVKTVQVDSDIYSPSIYRIPIQSDFLVAYATPFGYYSWRNEETGTCFIQAFCTELTKYWKTYDVVTILTFVIHKVAYDFDSKFTVNPYARNKKQIPCVLTKLTRFLKFTPKEIKDNAICNDGS